MPEYNVYKLASQSMSKAMPKFAELVSNAKKRIVILCSSVEAVRECDNILWTYAQLSFLPHATHLDPYPKEQPVYITQDISDRANNGEILLIYNAADYIGRLQNIASSAFEKVVMFVEPTHDTLLQQITAELAGIGASSRFFVQRSDGSWQT